jgi:quercetin dioxygenase-like cupin family protein
MALPPFDIVDFQAIPPVKCPCGSARRAFMETADFPGSLHMTEITEHAQTHFHTRITEVYYILECEPQAALELNGELHAVQAGMAILIRPGTRHRAVGKMKILLLAIPKFDASDEFLVNASEHIDH